MVQITYVEHDGTEHVVDSQTGVSLMQAAIDNLVPASMPIAEENVALLVMSW